MVLIQGLSGIEKYQMNCQGKAQGLFNEDARSERILISESKYCPSNTAFSLVCLKGNEAVSLPALVLIAPIRLDYSFG